MKFSSENQVLKKKHLQIKITVLYLFLMHAYKLLCKIVVAFHTSPVVSPLKKWFQHLSEKTCAV